MDLDWLLWLYRYKIRGIYICSLRLLRMAVIQGSKTDPSTSNCLKLHTRSFKLVKYRVEISRITTHLPYCSCTWNASLVCKQWKLFSHLTVSAWLSDTHYTEPAFLSEDISGFWMEHVLCWYHLFTPRSISTSLRSLLQYWDEASPLTPPPWQGLTSF